MESRALDHLRTWTDARTHGALSCEAARWSKEVDTHLFDPPIMPVAERVPEGTPVELRDFAR